MRGWLWFWCRLRSIRPSSNLLPEDGDYTSTWYVIFVAFKSFVSTFRAHLIIVLLHCIYRLWWHWTKELRLLYLGWYIAANWQSDKCETSSFIYPFHFFIEACIFRLVSLTRSFCILNCSKVPTSSPSQQPTNQPTVAPTDVSMYKDWSQRIEISISTCFKWNFFTKTWLLFCSFLIHLNYSSKVPTSSPSQQPTSSPTQVCLDRCFVAQCIC